MPYGRGGAGNLQQSSATQQSLSEVGAKLVSLHSRQGQRSGGASIESKLLPDAQVHLAQTAVLVTLANDSDDQCKQQSRDLEANRQVHDAEAELARAEARARSRRESEPYAHTGRGGAGNWFSPQNLAANGTFVNTAATGAATTAPEGTHSAAASSASDATTQGARAVKTTAIPGMAASERSRKVGRGGAGNFVWDASGPERQAELARQEQEQVISHDAARDVELGLAKPGRAVLKHETLKESER